jgi:ketosteroid isomerase-like protein
MIRILVLLFPIVAFANVQESNAKKEVLAAMHTWRQAMIARDRTMLDALYAPDLDYAHSSGKHENKAEAIEAVVNGKDRIEFLELTDIVVTVYGATALVKAKIVMRLVSAATATTLNLDVLHVWIKNGAAWQMVARHSARLNP